MGFQSDSSPTPTPQPTSAQWQRKHSRSPRRTLRVSWWIASQNSLAFLADVRQDSPGMMEEAMTAGTRLETLPSADIESFPCATFLFRFNDMWTWRFSDAMAFIFKTCVLKRSLPWSTFSKPACLSGSTSLAFCGADKNLMDVGVARSASAD